MNTQPLSNMDTRMATWSGMVLVVFMNITTGELVKTVVLAAIGAVVSFMISWTLKKSVRWYKKQKDNRPNDS